jgi:hypothetical protein
MPAGRVTSVPVKPQFNNAPVMKLNNNPQGNSQKMSLGGNNGGNNNGGSRMMAMGGGGQRRGF